MAIKTFTTGEVLTASDTNQFLTNSGLVYITSSTIPATQTTTNIQGCFSSTYDSYRIVINNMTASDSANYAGYFYIRMLSGTTAATTNYTYGFTRIDIAAGTFSGSSGALSSVGPCAWQNGSQVNASFDILNPYRAAYTTIPNLQQINTGSGYMGTGAVLHQTATAYDGFQIGVSAGTFGLGTITVYGYRKA